MTYRTDKFAVGDNVVWANEHIETARSLFMNGWSNGPFIIETVIDRSSNWDSIGHTQHLIIKEFPDMGTWSGAFFNKA
jgi:hypothetical protein